MSVAYLTLEDLLHLAQRNSYVVRDVGLLAGAAARPQTSVFGEDAYPTVQDKAAVLVDSICNTQPLQDANMRLSLRAAQSFLRLGGLSLDLTNDEAFEVILWSAQTPHPGWRDLARRLPVVPMDLPQREVSP